MGEISSDRAVRDQRECWTCQYSHCEFSVDLRRIWLQCAVQGTLPAVCSKVLEHWKSDKLPTQVGCGLETNSGDRPNIELELSEKVFVHLSFYFILRHGEKKLDLLIFLMLAQVFPVQSCINNVYAHRSRKYAADQTVSTWMNPILEALL